MFTSKRLSKGKDGENQIKKWKHDLETNILEIETTRSCSLSSVYELKLTISYKNYGTMQIYEKNSKHPQV